MPNGLKFNSNYPVIEESNKIYKRALDVIPSVTQTLAKGPSQYVNGAAPKYLVRGKGSHVWDADGNEYLDFNMGIGPLSLGYGYEKVDEAIKKQLDDGITFSLMHPLEVEVAELIRKVIPNAEAVRYSKGGADVTSAAVRLARAYTGKNKVLCCGYHGWHDWHISVTPRSAGIPQPVKDLTFTFNYNDIESLEKSIDDDTACVILEPVVFELPKNDFLKQVSELCKKKDVLLIFDEMWTGFRISLGGAQEYYDVTPDLACYSKAVANGMPVAILTGKMEIMNLLEDQVFFYNTFGGEALSLAAAKATIEEIRDKNVPSYLRNLGRKLMDGYNNLAETMNLDFTKCIGYEARTMVTFSDKRGDPLLIKSLVQQEMIKRGILWSGFHNLSFSHTEEEIDYTLNVYEEVLYILNLALKENKVRETLRGAPVQPVFRKTSDFNLKPVGSK